MVLSAHRRLRLRSLLALWLIGATGTALVAALLVTLDQTATAEVGVNLAGRQRMLSQRIARDALQAVRGGPADPAVAALAAHASDLRRFHAALRDGDPALGLSGPPSPEVAAAFARLDGTVRSIAAASEALVGAVEAEEPEAAAVALGSVLHGADQFLPRMDETVFRMASGATAARARLRMGALAGLGLLIAALAAVGRFVLRPAVRGAAAASARVQSVIDAIPDAIAVREPTGALAYRNEAGARETGADAPGPEDLHVLRTGTPTLNLDEHAADGGRRLTTKVPILDDAGRVTGLVSVSRDVTELRAAEDRFRALVEGSVAGTAIVRGGEIVYANPRLAEIFGVPPGAMVGRAMAAFLDAEPPPDEPRPVRRGARPDGRPVYVEVSTTPIAGEGGGAEVWTFLDVTAREEVERTLFHQAHHDELTGLANRALFRARLAVALADAGRDGAFAVLYIDLDHFKTVNDTFGHAVGDRLLQVVAARIREAVRPGDTVARIGGDEFAVLLLDPPAPTFAADVGGRILRAMDVPAPLGGDTTVRPSVSIGAIDSELAHETEDDVMNAADRAMYRAKASGRGRVGTVAEVRPLLARRA